MTAVSVKSSPKQNDADQDKIGQLIRDLTISLLYLTRWTDDKPTKLPPGTRVRWRAWRGHDWGALDRLKKEGLIDFSYRAKSVWLSEEGEREALRVLDALGFHANGRREK